MQELVKLFKMLLEIIILLFRMVIKRKGQKKEEKGMRSLCSQPFNRKCWPLFSFENKEPKFESSLVTAKLSSAIELPAERTSNQRYALHHSWACLSAASAPSSDLPFATLATFQTPMSAPVALELGPCIHALSASYTGHRCPHTTTSISPTKAAASHCWGPRERDI